MCRFSEHGLLVANTGAALTAEGVLALSTLRASAKTQDDIGRFGVGFAAVLAVSDAPQLGSRGMPSVRWSADETAALVAQLPSLSADLASRGGHVPVLRLPFAAAPLDVPGGYDTAVWLPFRSAGAGSLARELVAELDPTLLLVLRGLDEFVVDGVAADPRVLRCEWDGDCALLDGRTWVRAQASGDLPASLRTELRLGESPRWSVAAYAPADGGELPPSTPCVLRAPTPTDEPLSLPVVVTASVPLEPTRRRIVRGPTASFVLARAGEAIANLAAALPAPWALVPTGLAASDVDAEIRAALATRLPETPLFAGRLARDCVVLDVGEATAAVAQLLAAEVEGLLPVSAAAPGHRAAIDFLGVRRLDTAGVVELLAGLRRPPVFWRSAYRALSRADDQDSLRALPVPLLDGRTVTGAGGALLPSGTLRPEVAALPLRIVHPDAVDPLLERLGARHATAASLLADPAVREAVSGEEYEPELVRAVVALAAEADTGADAMPWLADLLLPSVDGELVPAADLLWPVGLMVGLIDPEVGLAVLDPPAWLDRAMAGRLGVLDSPTLIHRERVRLDDLLVEAEEDELVAELDGIAEWAQDALAAEIREVGEFRAVRDLDVVGDLPAMLRLISRDPALRAAVVTPVRDGAVSYSSYTAWWLGQQAVLDGLLPGECVLPGDALLTGLYENPPTDLDHELLRALGVRVDLASVMADADGLGDLLDRLGDAERTVARAQAHRLHAAIASAWHSRLSDAPDPPLAVRAVRSDGVLTALPSDRAVLVDAPDQLFFLAERELAVVPAPAAASAVLAELLDVTLGSELALPVPSDGREVAVPQGFADLAPGVRTYRHHDEGELGVPWRFVDGVLHATIAGLPTGLAWAAGHWSRRHLFLTAALRPEDVQREQLEYDLES